MPRPPVTHCPHGHEYTDANTYRRPNGSRVCIECRSRWAQHGRPGQQLHARDRRVRAVVAVDVLVPSGTRDDDAARAVADAVRLPAEVAVGSRLATCAGVRLVGAVRVDER